MPHVWLHEQPVVRSLRRSAGDPVSTWNDPPWGPDEQPKSLKRIDDLIAEVELRELLHDCLDAVNDYKHDIAANLGREPQTLVHLSQRVWQYLKDREWLND